MDENGVNAAVGILFSISNGQHDIVFLKIEAANCSKKHQITPTKKWLLTNKLIFPHYPFSHSYMIYAK